MVCSRMEAKYEVMCVSSFPYELDRLRLCVMICTSDSDRHFHPPYRDGLGRAEGGVCGTV